MFSFNNSPIRRNFFANFLGVGVQLLNQLGLVPLYLTCWKVDLYSDWLVLSAITAFFSMSDAGLNNVTQNEFAIRYAEGKAQTCRSLIANNYILVSVVTLIAMVGSSLFTYFCHIEEVLELHSLRRVEANVTFLILVFTVFLGMFTGIPDVVYRSHSKADKAIHLNNITRLLEFGVVLLCLLTGVTLPVLVSLFLLPRFLVYLYKLYDTHRMFPLFSYWTHGDKRLFKEILLPSLTFMSFPIGNAIVYQGFTLLVNRFFGAESVVIYNTTRTMTSFMRQLLATIQISVWPEFSLAYGRKDFLRMRSLHRKVFRTANGLGVFLSIGLLILGPYVYEIWTQGTVSFNYPLTIAFLCVLLVENLWTTDSMCLMAINRHGKVGGIYVCCSLLALLFAYVYLDRFFLVTSPLILLLIHVPLSIYTRLQRISLFF